MNYINTQPPNKSQTDEVMEFRNSQKVGLQVTASLGTSLIIIVIIAMNLFLMFLSSKPHSVSPGLMGGLAVIPVMGITAAICLLKSPVRILLDDQKLTLQWLIRRKTFLWKEISEIQLKKADSSLTGAFTSKKDAPKERLLLLDHNSHKIAEIPASIKPFDVLVREIHNRTSLAKGTSTFNIDKQTSQEIAARGKKRIYLLILGIPFVALGVTMGITSLVTEYNKRLLEKDGQIIQAAVTRHYIYNITPRMEYTFVAPDGRTYSKNVMVDRNYWDTVEKQETVPVKYLPTNPSKSKLTFGQIDDADIPLPLVIAASLFVTAMGFVCMIMYFFRISDIKFEKGRFKIERTKLP